MIIGLSVNHKDGTSRIADAYVNAVVKAGGSPVLIPLTTNRSVLEENISHIDGLLLSGGGDICTPLFNEELHPTVTDYDLERDHYEIEPVRMAAAYDKVKALHKKIYTIDSHCDTPMFFSQGIDIGKKNNKTKVDIPKMQEGMLDAVFMVAYLPQGARTAAASQKAFDKAVSIINQIKQQVEKNKDLVAIANSVEDLKKNKAESKKTIFIGIENGYAIGKDIRNVEYFARMGVKYITLSHNGDNDICDSNRGNKEHKGLSEFGREVVREMNRLGIMVDISHTSEKTSFDVLEISQYPVIASHSSVKALCNHPRNISDKLMKAIAAKRGLIQICFYKGFLKKDGQAKLKDAIDHIDYVVKSVGVDYVGIGTDFDGDGGIPGIQNASEAPQITLELLRRGYSDEDIAKIWGGNLIRVMEAVKKAK
ncbi:MAG: membrane dipeptidase [Dysgonamonadaceae bacterium]|jgi:microsomal dipeptidase-like Zn-dependent dipeptidase|nr:membrane dipeptidase [Dysgonamonadaceae bacterium]